MRRDDPELGMARSVGHLEMTCEIAGERLELLLDYVRGSEQEDLARLLNDVCQRVEEVNTMLSSAIVFSKAAWPRPDYAEQYSRDDLDADARLVCGPLDREG